MTEVTIKNTSRVIRDSAWPSVENVLKKRLEELKDVPGKEKEYQIALERYTGLTIDDVVIEPVRSLPDGKRLVCMTSRKTGFVKSDIEIQQLPAGEIISRVDHVQHLLDNKVDLQNFIKGTPTIKDVVYVKETDVWYGFIAGVTPVLEIGDYLGGVYFDKGEWSPNETTPTLEDGHYVINVTDPSVIPTNNTIHLFDLTLIEDETKHRPVIKTQDLYTLAETKVGDYNINFEAIDHNNKTIKNVKIKKITWPTGIFSGTPTSSVAMVDGKPVISGKFSLPVKYLNKLAKVSFTAVFEVTNVDDEISESRETGFNINIDLDLTRVSLAGHNLYGTQSAQSGTVAGWSFNDNYSDIPFSCTEFVTGIETTGYKGMSLIDVVNDEIRYNVTRIHFDWDVANVKFAERRIGVNYHTGALQSDFIGKVSAPVVIDHTKSSLELGVKATTSTLIEMKDPNIKVMGYRGDAPQIGFTEQIAGTDGVYNPKTKQYDFVYTPVPPLGANQPYSVSWMVDGVITMEHGGKQFEAKVHLVNDTSTADGKWGFNVPGYSLEGGLAITVPLGLDGASFYLGDYALPNKEFNGVKFSWPPANTLPPYQLHGKQYPRCQIAAFENGSGSLAPADWINKTKEVTAVISAVVAGVYTISHAKIVFNIRAPGYGWLTEFHIEDNKLVGNIKPPADWQNNPQVKNLELGKLAGKFTGDLQSADFVPVNPQAPIWGPNTYVWGTNTGGPLLGSWELENPQLVLKIGNKPVAGDVVDKLITQYPVDTKCANGIFFDNVTMNALVGWENPNHQKNLSWNGYETTIDGVLNNVPTRSADQLTKRGLNLVTDISQESFGTNPKTPHNISFKYPSSAEPNNPRTTYVLPKFNLPLAKVKFDGLSTVSGKTVAKFKFEGLESLKDRVDSLIIEPSSSMFELSNKPDGVELSYTPSEIRVPSLSPIPAITITASYERSINNVKYGAVGWYGKGTEGIWHSPVKPIYGSRMVIRSVVKQDKDVIITLLAQIMSPGGGVTYQYTVVDKFTSIMLDGIDHTASTTPGTQHKDTGEFDIKISNVPDNVTLNDIEISLDLNTGKWSTGFVIVSVDAQKKA